MYFAISFTPNSDARLHHPTQETIEQAMADADKTPEHEAQIVRLKGMQAVVASREAGHNWKRI